MFSVYLKATGKFHKAFVTREDADAWCKLNALGRPITQADAYEICEGVPNEYIKGFASREKNKWTKQKIVSIDEA